MKYLGLILALLFAGIAVSLFWVGQTAASLTLLAFGMGIPFFSAKSRVDSSGSEQLTLSYTPLANEISECTSGIAIGSANVSHFLDKLAAVFTEQVDKLQSIVSRIKILQSSNASLLQDAESAENQLCKADEKTQQSNALLAQVLAEQERLNQQIGQSQSNLALLQQNADSISGIVNVINALADQTNMLALNAAIEAARAGEHGKGFAVVADEVRELAKKTTDATKNIDCMLKEMNSSCRASYESVENIVAANDSMNSKIQMAGQLVADASAMSTEASTSLANVRSTLDEHNQSNCAISEHIDTLYQQTSCISADLEDASERALNVSNQTESIFRHVQTLGPENRIALVKDVAIAAAAMIADELTKAVERGMISQADLFNFTYESIPNTNPTQYHSKFDRTTDRLFPGIQEPILQRHDFVIFAGAVDKNGYFPTHNKKFSKPATGDYKQDVKYSRSKRIFGDRTGKRCGSNTAEFLLQTYKRDTGEIMHDLCAPITIGGRHWGGFRIGFKAIQD